MKIPIGRYRILGVNIGADSHIIFNQLERKLAKSEYPGFSNETLEKRSEILKECSSILLDGERRTEYEKEYTTQRITSKKDNEPETTISKGREIAGLLLLLEAGGYEECIIMSEELYREQRMSMSYFSSEYKEINRIIDYATLGLAKDLKYKRHFEAAAEILERRISSQTVGMGEKERITQMVSELNKLLPFRVLDTLSRNNDERVHLKGIALLKILVKERGGLEADSEIHMDRNEFYAFFKQIRSYLSVQEQVSLYEEWSNDGSNAATFLNCIALTAQGFAQRKPQRIDEALRKIKMMNAKELQPMVANMHLLLGNVENATHIFEADADQDLKQWANTRSKDTLGGLCEWCREWLKRDVINGYRDIDIDADLESYFSDKDVIQYIENEDSSDHMGKNDKRPWRQRDVNIMEEKNELHISNPIKYANIKFNWTGLLRPRKDFIGQLKENTLVFAIIVISTCSLLFFTTFRPHSNTRNKSMAIKTIKKDYQAKKDMLGTQEQLKETLSEWLQVKRQSLETNQFPLAATKVATPRLLEQLREETEQNRRRGQTQIIDVEVKGIVLKNESPRRAEISAELKYRDKTINKAGEILTETESHTFQRKYNFIWNGSKWVIDK